MPFLAPFWPIISSFVLGLTGSVAARVLTSLGIGFVSYAVLDNIVSDLVSSAKFNYNSAPAVVLQLMNLTGFDKALNTLTSALVTKAAMMAAKALRPL
jgi:hypothetical protein